MNQYRLVIRAWDYAGDSILSKAIDIAAAGNRTHDPLGFTSGVAGHLIAQIDPLYTQDTLRNYLATVLQPDDEVTRIVFIVGMGIHAYTSSQPPDFPIRYQNLWLVRNDNATRAIYFDGHTGKVIDSTVDLQLDPVPQLFRNRRNNYSQFIAGFDEFSVISWWKSGHGNHLVVAGSDTIPCFSPLRPVTDPHRQPTLVLRDFVCRVRTIIGDTSNTQRVPDSMFVVNKTIAQQIDSRLRLLPQLF